MKIALITLLAAAPMVVMAGSADKAMRADCSARPATTANEYEFNYTKGKLGCSERQYNQYLASLDPAQVMAANPTAAGKPAADEFQFSYRKGKLKADGK